MRARRSPRKGRRAWGLAAWFSSQPHPYVLPPAALGRTVQGKAQPGSGSGSLEVLSKGSLLGPAVPAGCVGSWVKDTAGTGSREGRAPWCRGEFQSELPRVVLSGGTVGSGLSNWAVFLTRLRICCLRESMCLEPHRARGLSPLTIQFPL